LAGHHLLVTGATGFLAKAFVEKLLRSVDTLGGIHLLVREKSGGSDARRRVMQEVLGTRAFDRLRASWGESFGRICDEKVHVVCGDLTRERFGLDPAAYQALTRTITLVVNSAATVTFDERLDLAINLNTLGPSRLLRFAKDCGDAPFLHVSTCYVCGRRTGVVVEDFSAPEMARESLPYDKSTGSFDLDSILQMLTTEAGNIKDKHGSDTEESRRELIDAGMRLSRAHGWHDTYTFTKWIGEQLLLRDRGNVPLVVFRPAIIEGSYDEPTPGWIDGLRMADPIIVAYGKGKLNQFPGASNIAIDLIPVDFVANAMIATLPAGGASGDTPVAYQCASSEQNPLMLSRVRVALERAFRKRPMNDDNGRPIHPGPLQIVDRSAFVARLESKRRWLLRYRSLLERLGAASRRIRRLSSILRQIEQLTYFAKIYSPYTHLDCQFATDELQAAARRLHPDDREEFHFDIERVDWDDYIINRHVPGLRSFVLGTAAEPSARIRGGSRSDIEDVELFTHSLQGESIFEIFRRTAERCPDKPVFRVKRRNRWIRYTYDEALRATGTIMSRFTERGLKPGDRVAICGENCPEWGLCYLAVMRAGLTAVPLDPQMLPDDAWSAARFAEAKLMFASPQTRKSLTKSRIDGDAELLLLREPFIPPPGASRDVMPEQVTMDGTSIASILFTSGTTVAPKAVPLTHRNFIANAQAMLQVHPAHPSDEFLSVLPMYHAFEFTGGFFVPIACGSTITYVDQLKGPELTAAMQATGTTLMLVVPRLLRMFLDSIESRIASASRMKRSAFGFLRALSAMTGHRLAHVFFRSVHQAFGGRLRMLVCGGSRLDPELLDGFARLGFPIYEGYGLTETAPVLTLCPPGGARGGAVGPPLPNVEIEIRHPTLDGIGEVWVRGPNVMSGYLNNLEATKEILHDGWLRTGDLGRLDADGYLHITGRSKDLIVSGAGKNVYPDEVEIRYRDLPFVKELCVFGMPSSDGLGDLVHAVIVIDPEAAADAGIDRSSIERDIRLAVASLSESLPSHQRIAALHFWDRDLPKTSTMKAKRGLIRDMVLAEDAATSRPSASSITAGSTEPTLRPVESSPATLTAIRRIIAQQAHRPEASIQPVHHLLLDLGIDSIGKIDILGAIETRFDMEIDDAVGAKIARVADILAAVGTRSPVGGEGRARNGSAWQRRLGTAQEVECANGRMSAPLLPIRWLLRGAVGGFMHSYVRVNARGRENIPGTGPFVLAPNHSSHLDSPSVLTAVGGRRRVWVAGAEDYFFNTSVKRFVFGKVLDTIAFDRHADGLVGLRRCGAALARGDGLLLFPEGTRSVSGEIQSFRIGTAVLALERNAPIVPVYIEHAYELFPKGSSFPRPGVVNVSFGKPIQPPRPEAGVDHYALFHALTREVEWSVRSMARESSGQTGLHA
jgi:long-chain acyl-CoA synthetase